MEFKTNISKFPNLVFSNADTSNFWLFSKYNYFNPLKLSFFNILIYDIELSDKSNTSKFLNFSKNCIFDSSVRPKYNSFKYLKFVITSKLRSCFKLLKILL